MLFKCKQFDVLQSPEVFKITTDATLLGACAWNDCELSGTRILEVGSGTGIISLMLAQRFPEVKIHAIDKSPLAAELSNVNFENSKFSDRLSAVTEDLLMHVGTYDHIIINPPYFQDDTKSLSTSELGARHLDGMNYQSLVERLLALIDEDGSIEMIHPLRYISDLGKAVVSCGACVQRVINIRHNENSVIRNCISRIAKSGAMLESEFFNIRNVDNSFSRRYIELLRQFINV